MRPPPPQLPFRYGAFLSYHVSYLQSPTSVPPPQRTPNVYSFSFLLLANPVVFPLPRKEYGEGSIGAYDGYPTTVHITDQHLEGPPPRELCGLVRLRELDLDGWVKGCRVRDRGPGWAVWVEGCG